MKTSPRWSPAVLGAIAMSILLAGCAGPAMTARVWPAGKATDYPEWEGRARPRRLVGLAFSGGGSMSATASVGALRGLAHLGLLDDVDYISGVSGGTWGVLPYVFLDLEEARRHGKGLGDIRSQAELEARYLGTYKPPGQLTAGDLTARPPGSLVSMVTDTAFRLPITSLRGDENFAHMASQTYLAPLGLGDDRRFVCDTEAHVQEILARNSHLQHEDFYVAGKDKPFLIANMAFQRVQRATLLHMYGALAFKTKIPEAFFPAEATPRYTGMATLNRHDSRYAPFPEFPAGGGFIETFGFDASFDSWIEPRKMASVHHPGSAQWFQRGQPFSLGDMMAASGAAPAAAAGALVDAFGIRPEFHTFVPSEESPRANSRERPFVDGGACDVTGVAALLARGATHIVAFLNPVPPYDSGLVKRDGVESKVAYMLSALFGRVGVEERLKFHAALDSARTNRLLADPDGRKLRRIEAAFDRCAQTGKPLVFCDDYMTAPNGDALCRYNVKPNRPVRICWVYLTAATFNEQKLKNSPALAKSSRLDAWRRGLTKEAGEFFTPKSIEKHALRDFPSIAVMFATRNKAQDLDPVQANALAHYSSYNVVASAAEIRRVLARP